MKRIQIACCKTDWDASVITVLGREKNGRRCLPWSFKAFTLPEPWFAVWRGLVKTLRGVAPGEWAATYIEASRMEQEDGTPAVRLTIYRKWDDDTTAEPVVLVLPEAVEFFNFLTR